MRIKTPFQYEFLFFLFFLFFVCISFTHHYDATDSSTAAKQCTAQVPCTNALTVISHQRQASRFWCRSEHYWWFFDQHHPITQFPHCSSSLNVISLSHKCDFSNCPHAHSWTRWAIVMERRPEEMDIGCKRRDQSHPTWEDCTKRSNQSVRTREEGLGNRETRLRNLIEEAFATRAKQIWKRGGDLSSKADLKFLGVWQKYLHLF